MGHPRPSWVCRFYPHDHKWVECNVCIDGYRKYLMKGEFDAKEESGRVGGAPVSTGSGVTAAS